MECRLDEGAHPAHQEPTSKLGIQDGDAEDQKMLRKRCVGNALCDLCPGAAAGVFLRRSVSWI